MARRAVLAEAAGLDTLWFANHLFQRDPVVGGTVALAATRRLRVALMAISPYASHPVQAAMTAASLDEHFPGRAVLSLGVGAPGDFAAAGIGRPRPLATMGEAIGIARGLLAGEAVAHEGVEPKGVGHALSLGNWSRHL